MKSEHEKNVVRKLVMKEKMAMVTETEDGTHSATVKEANVSSCLCSSGSPSLRT
jgi:hypothetical protein